MDWLEGIRSNLWAFPGYQERWSCKKKKVGLAGIKYSDKHLCDFDFKKLRQANPKVEADKVTKI
jgi:hypothetical protein